MRTREEQIAHLSCAIFNERPGNIDDCMSLAREYILEAERRAEQRVRAEMSVGYIFHNPDTGTEILPYHPVESGECLDAQDIRQATAEVLREKLVSTWEEMANEHREREKRGEESRKDSERLDWLLSQTHYGIPGFDPKVSGRDPSARKADLIRAIDAAREVG